MIHRSFYVLEATAQDPHRNECNEEENEEYEEDAFDHTLDNKRIIMPILK